MSEAVHFVTSGGLPDSIMVGSIFRTSDDEMVRYVPERTCETCAINGTEDMTCQHCRWNYYDLHMTCNKVVDE